MSSPEVKRILSGDDHEDAKWVVLEGSLDGIVKRRSINTQALVDGTLTLADEKAKLIADVEEYHARWLAVQSELANLGLQE